MNQVNRIQQWLSTTDLAGWVVPSTDEFLSEFAPPANRRLQWATGFQGSTGLAVILRDAAALFLDGRYLLQAAADVDETLIALESVALPNRRAWLKRSLACGARLGFDLWSHSAADMQQWRALAGELGFAIESRAANPLDALWAQDRPSAHRPSIVDYPLPYAGEDYSAKCAKLVEHVRSAKLNAFLVADPEDVSWLLNVRAADESIKAPVGDWHVVPAATSRVLVQQDGTITWFVDEDRLSSEVAGRDRTVVALAQPDHLVDVLSKLAAPAAVIGADPRRTPSALSTVIETRAELRADDFVARRRWCKHPLEQESARRAHIIDAAAVVRFMAWLKRTVPARAVGEFEAAQMLETFRGQHTAYKGPSMPLMSASGVSGAQPHYLPRFGHDRQLNHHPIYWMDSGGQYLGGSTDNTLTLAVASPEPKHIQVHTALVRAFIALASARVPVGCYGLQLDLIGRQVLWREGMDFGHGTGHGVGNCLNIHEGPLLGREPNPFTTIAVEPGMIVTNEPGYYAQGDFGMRIESHMIVVDDELPGFLIFDTISRLPLDPDLVDFTRLTAQERRWLERYHQRVYADLQPLLDEQSASWLASVTARFTSY